MGKLATGIFLAFWLDARAFVATGNDDAET